MDVGAIREAMARQAVGLRELARRVHYSPGYLSRVLSGQQPGSPVLLHALTDALNLADDDDRLAYVVANPQRLDQASVEALASALAVQRREDDRVGPRPLIPAAERHRETLLSLLRDARGPHRDALACVVAEHVQFTGWLHAELHHDPSDRRAFELFRAALVMADEVDAGPLAAQVLNHIAGTARELKRWGAVHRNYMAAYVSDSHLHQQVTNGANASVAAAKLGRRKEAERLLAEVEILRERLGNAAPPAMAYWLTPEWLTIPIGHAHLALGRPREAAACIRAGLDSLPPEHRHVLWTRNAWNALARAENEG